MMPRIGAAVASPGGLAGSPLSVYALPGQHWGARRRQSGPIQQALEARVSAQRVPKIILTWYLTCRLSTCFVRL